MIIVLMVIMVLGILVPTGYVMFNKLLMNDTRIVHQKQAVNIAVSAMETFQSQEDLMKIDYLTSNLHTPDNPLSVLKSNTNDLDLYQYAEDGNGNRLTPQQLESLIGEYTVVVRGISGDLNHNQKKDDNEPFYYEHKMEAVETVYKGMVRIEQKDWFGNIYNTEWMSFCEFLNTYNLADEGCSDGNGAPEEGEERDEEDDKKNNCNGKKNDKCEGNDKCESTQNDKCGEFDKQETSQASLNHFYYNKYTICKEPFRYLCEDEEWYRKLVLGDVTIFGVGSSEVFDKVNNINIISVGSITFKGQYTIEAPHSGHTLLGFTSVLGDIVVEKTTMKGTGHSNTSSVILQSILGDVKINQSNITSNRNIYVLAGYFYNPILDRLSYIAPGRDVSIVESSTFAKKQEIIRP
ncbi:hypothetical protein ACSVDE_10765 [Pseudalkalibacillus sp. Hm43]|uniref:hypothetical protein n=1 Tax=Pseudalkalibacillus sp. Hm43 TaxID=3450742 RepID=UPI003F41F9DC